MVSKELGLSWTDLWLIVVSAVGIYALVILSARVFGQRSLASLSAFDFTVTVAMGALVGRVVLVRTSLLGGVVGVVTLFVLQAVVGYLRGIRRIGQVVDNAPIVVMVEGRMLPERLEKSHLTHADVLEKLRSSGVRRMDEVRAVVLERSGSISVVKGDGPLDPEVFSDCAGRELLPSG